MDNLNQFMNEQPFITGIIFLLIGAIVGAYAKDWINSVLQLTRDWLSRQNISFASRSLRKLEHDKELAEHFQKNPIAMYNLLWQITLYFFQSIIWVLLILLVARLWDRTDYGWITNSALGAAVGIMLSTLRTINNALRGIQHVRDDRRLNEQIEQLRQKYDISLDNSKDKSFD